MLRCGNGGADAASFVVELWSCGDDELKQLPGLCLVCP